MSWAPWPASVSRLRCEPGAGVCNRCSANFWEMMYQSTSLPRNSLAWFSPQDSKCWKVYCVFSCVNSTWNKQKLNSKLKEKKPNEILTFLPVGLSDFFEITTVKFFWISIYHLSIPLSGPCFAELMQVGGSCVHYSAHPTVTLIFRFQPYFSLLLNNCSKRDII